MVGNFKIRKATVNDLTRICEVEDASFSNDPYPAFLIERLLTDESSISYVATGNSGKIIGYIVSKIEDHAAHLISVAVLPTERRRRVGSQLLKELATVLRQKGIREIRLEVRTDNKNAIQLYNRFEFREESVIPRYYSDGSSALLMRKMLDVS